METVYKDTVGKTISITVTSAGSPVDLTACTVALKLYAFGTDALKWSHDATLDAPTLGTAHYTSAAGDFDTVGDYYSLVVVTKTGFASTYLGGSYRVVANSDSQVTPQELLQFLDIPSENAKPEDVIQIYINQAKSLLLLQVPTLRTTQNQYYVDIMQKLVMLKAAVIYFMNSGESNINPDIRMQKIKLWTEEYENSCDKLNAAMETSTTSTGLARRSTNTTVFPNPIDSDYEP
ncbi:MAG: BppU family phage baseplate upper protein [Candidatus Omnitrophica bacterium]|nr:BppU family phage baseplate upper protein [Candidatus Omnitrophota bacterium]